MPNQRKKGKRSIGFYFTEEERKMLREAAAEAGMNMSDFVKFLVKNIAQKKGMKK